MYTYISATITKQDPLITAHETPNNKRRLITATFNNKFKTFTCSLEAPGSSNRTGKKLLSDDAPGGVRNGFLGQVKERRSQPVESRVPNINNTYKYIYIYNEVERA